MSLVAPPAGTTVTEAELLSHGIDPAAPVGKREPSYPLDVRCGDDRYTRTASGCVAKHYGYYSPGQVAARRKTAALFVKSIRKLLPKP